MSGIVSEIYDIGLISGSADTFRSAAGGYWYVVETDYGEVLSLEPGEDESPVEPKISKIFLSDGDPERGEQLVPVRSRAVRFANNGDNIVSDQEWKAFFMGGDYGDISYRRLYNDQNLDYFYFSYDFPYPEISASMLESQEDPVSVSDRIQITTDYKDYLPNYQNYIRNRKEVNIPSYYIMADLSRYNFTEDTSSIGLYPPELINYVSLEGAYENINGLFDFNGSLLPEEPDSATIESFGPLIQRNTNLAIDYLSDSYVLNELSASTAEWASSKLKTLLFDSGSIANFRELSRYQDCLPFKMNITFQTKPTGEFFNNIQDSGFSQRFLKTLYKTFSGLKEDLQPNSRDYLKSNQYNVADDVSSYVEDLESVSYREIDYLKFLTYCRNNFNEPIGDAIFVGERNLNRASYSRDSQVSRHINSTQTTICLSHAVRFMNNLDVSSWEDLFSANAGHRETLAYRVEKTGGRGVGDRNTRMAMQNYWFINSFNGDEFEFCDNQIKYDTDYTYTVYAYVLVVGMRYGFSDLRLSRDIGCVGGPEDEWGGLEFYDPLTIDDDRADRIYDQTGKTGGPGRFSYAIENTTYGSEAQLYSFFPYLADMRLNYQPTVKIVEIPLYSKTLRMLDAPPNRINVVPYHTIDKTHRVGFDMTYNSFSSMRYPGVVTNRDQRRKDQFLNAKDLTEEHLLGFESVTRPIRLEIYRTDIRPKLLSDFDGNLRATIDLTFENRPIVSKTNNFHEERIRANTKFYYLFRAVNRLGMSSHIGEIYEVELINDGGYIYPLFNTIKEEEIELEQNRQPTKTFKKVFQLQPNFNQISLNTDNIDYDDTANSQIGNLSIGTADELIWDKTFKIRLTSKKTGRKIDLNITYKLTEQ